MTGVDQGVGISKRLMTTFDCLPCEELPAILLSILHIGGDAGKNLIKGFDVRLDVRLWLGAFGWHFVFSCISVDCSIATLMILP